jgi:hypothetical protein
LKEKRRDEPKRRFFSGSRKKKELRRERFARVGPTHRSPHDMGL